MSGGRHLQRCCTISLIALLGIAPAAPCLAATPQAAANTEQAIEHHKLILFWATQLSNSDALLRKSALRQLANLKAQSVLAQIIPLTGDPQPEVRISACRTIGLLADKKFIPMLRSLAQKDAESTVRRAAGRAADQIKAREE